MVFGLSQLVTNTLLYTRNFPAQIGDNQFKTDLLGQ